ncbi:MAG: peptidylprolyl isomerase [Kofleriaceae bacterium]
MSRAWVLALLLTSTSALAVPGDSLPAIEIANGRVEFEKSPSLSTDVLFEVGETAIKAAGNPILDGIAKVVAKGATSFLSVEVHSDDTAPDGDTTGVYLGKLTQKRADAVKTYLIRRGIPARRITAKGSANKQPLSDNGSAAGRRTNRRVEFLIVAEVRPPAASDLDGYVKAVKGNGPKLMAKIDTSQGALNCELYADKAPIAVANFIGLATGQKAFIDKNGKTARNRPFYNGLVFHRVIPGFMIQGGDPKGIGTGGPGYTFDDEISAESHTAGTLAMANAGPRTNGSQFFITEVSAPHLNNRHTIFGRCKEVEVITKIANVARGADDKPTTPVTITRVTISKAQ